MDIFLTPEPSKTVLVVQSYDLLTVNDLFCDLGIQLLLPWGFVGNQSLVTNFIDEQDGQLQEQYLG